MAKGQQGQSLRSVIRPRTYKAFLRGARRGPRSGWEVTFLFEPDTEAELADLMVLPMGIAMTVRVDEWRNEHEGEPKEEYLHG